MGARVMSTTQTVVAVLALLTVAGSWLAIRWSQEQRAFRQILCAPIPTEDE
jgi:hypothetical protein